MSKPVSIAIIGGGASGTLTALHLVRKLNLPAHIYLIEKREEALYRGNAYSSHLDYEPLNVPAGKMSAFNHLPYDFFTWLKAERQAVAETEITLDSFVSRRWFGDYLIEKLKQATNQNKQVKVESIIAEVKDISFNTITAGYEVELSNRQSVVAGYLVFATGNEAPADVFTDKELALLNGHYVSNPWAVNPFKDLHTSDDILIVGTGLTMVDHVVSLKKQRHTGHIYCFSRNGYLPLPHTDTAQNYVFELPNEVNGLADIFSELRRNIALAGKKNIQWQNTLDALRGKTSRLWKLMDIDSKKLFLKRLRTFWDIHRHRMPLASAEALNELQQAGQLEFVPGAANGIERVGDELIFKFKPRRSNELRSVKVKRIINCTGPSGDYYKTGNTLIKNLLTKGWMKQDDLKIGIVTGVRGEIIKANGVVLQNAFSIGPLRKATEWETTAIREIRTQAEETAMHIASSLELSHEMMVEIGL